MIINHGNLAILNQAFSAAFKDGLTTAASQWSGVATLVPSTTAENKYAWLGKITKFREWLGDRQVQNLLVHDYAIKNKTFENTVAVGREEIEDDQFGVYKPVMQQMGQDAATHPDELVFNLLKDGFTKPCYDGQYFFDTDHPVGAPGSQASVSNFQGGSGAAWFLLDTSKVIKPIIYQKRREYAFISKTSLTDDNVFSRNEFVWGADGRSNVGFGLWQTAMGSKEDLDMQAYSDARAAMQSFKGDNGKPLAIRPTELWVPPNLEQAALEVLAAERLANGSTNVMRNTAKVVVCPWLA
ncbi:Mu-like prophage major head subunit gpT family protein [Comamonas aquatica]|uniref:Mu-like prophage major head subunit gpT family protein n=1 Tax=Comamonas aquatica TaxID=225991 RepID=UPI00244CD207|nr:Mu-like prophage major head subunit gpT family protein [Comamonas aquatica]MDH0494252.1 Mu-like prophage major head subunit gpT family protein [Comamonas aquatica]